MIELLDRHGRKAMLRLRWPMAPALTRLANKLAETHMSRPVKVTLMGRPFTLQTDEDEAHVQRVARSVDQRLADLRQKAALPLDSLALLVALTFADDLEKLRNQNAALLDDARDRADNLRQRLGRLAGE